MPEVAGDGAGSALTENLFENYLRVAPIRSGDSVTIMNERSDFAIGRALWMRRRVPAAQQKKTSRVEPRSLRPMHYNCVVHGTFFRVLRAALDGRFAGCPESLLSGQPANPTDYAATAAETRKREAFSSGAAGWLHGAADLAEQL